jgi:hypothetical protein
MTSSFVVESTMPQYLGNDFGDHFRRDFAVRMKIVSSVFDVPLDFLESHFFRLR